MTTKDVLDQLANLPPRELARVSDYCASLLEKSKIGPLPSEGKEEDPVEELIEILQGIEIDPTAVNGDTRLSYLLEKHGTKG